LIDHAYLLALLAKGSSHRRSHKCSSISRTQPRCSKDFVQEPTDSLPDPEEKLKNRNIHDRPPWNHHFVKENTMIYSKSAMSFNSSGLSNFATPKSKVSTEGIIDNGKTKESFASNLNDKSRQSSSDTRHSVKTRQSNKPH